LLRLLGLHCWFAVVKLVIKTNCWELHGKTVSSQTNTVDQTNVAIYNHYNADAEITLDMKEIAMTA